MLVYSIVLTYTVTFCHLRGVDNIQSKIIGKDMERLKGTISLDIADVVRNKKLKDTPLHNILKAIAVINSKLELNHVLKQVIYHATKLTHADAASIILISDSGQDLVIAYSTGPVSGSISNFQGQKALQDYA